MSNRMIPPYKPSQAIDGTWGFKTPTGRREGFATRFDALKASATAEREDRHEAEHGTGPIAEVLRKHFSKEETPNPLAGTEG